ncbi:DNA-dependent RNA polymerase II [Marasmius sp. AFHP31]|nr:DNA-dependent RNA polymerase II [Marasmius sp. AFHP31]
MLRSTFCILHGLQYQDLNDLNECPYDSGYFIITGSGKVLIAQERMAANHVYVSAEAQPSPINFLAEIRSTVEKGRKTIVLHEHFQKLGSSSAPGVISDRDILEHICYEMQDIQMLEISKPCNAVYAQEIGRRRCSMAKGSGSQKAYFFGYMTHQLLLVALERRELDDRDHFGKKQLDLAGPLLANLFRMLLRKLTKDVYHYMQKETHKEFNLTLAVKHQTITNGLRYSLATGNWGNQKKSMSSKAGVSTDMPTHRRSPICVSATPPLGREGKIAKPRQLHNTHWGMVCLAETPEGQACGLVLVNGVWMGVHRDPANLVKTVKKLRRKDDHDISPEVSVVRDIRERELRLYTDAGRVCRPLFIVENQQLLLQKKHVRWIANG